MHVAVIVEVGVGLLREFVNIESGWLPLGGGGDYVVLQSILLV
jgi:hypothetical protein